MVNQYTNKQYNIELESQLDDIIKEFQDGKALCDIATERGYTYGRVYNILKKSKYAEFISTKYNGKTPKSLQGYIRRRKIPITDRDTIQKRYEDGENLYDIAKTYNVTASSVHGFCKNHGIKRRTKQEAMNVLYEHKPELREVFRQLVYDGKTGYPRNIKRISWIEVACQTWLISKNFTFDREFQINNDGHFYDFRVKNVIIEMDGVHWHETKEQQIKDKRFEEIAIKHGFKVVRITDEQLRNAGNSTFDALVLPLLETY